ncbi:MAG: ABC transporter substrate-binding protein [Haloferacaceae archaeon]
MVPNHSETTDGVERRTFLRVSGAAGVAGLAGFAGCTGGGGGEETATATPGTGGQTTTTSGGGGAGKITFGQPALLSGGISFIQPPVSASSDIAHRMINEAGGPLDREIELVRRDTAYKPPKARKVLRQFINVDDAVVINGLTSTTTVPNWSFIQKQKVPFVTMYAGTRFLDTRGGDKGTPKDLSDDGWYWRTTGADTQHTAAAALHAKSAGATNIGVINTKTSGARTWAGAFYDAVEVIDGLSQAKRLEVEAGKTTYRSDLESFFQADIDLFGVAVEEAPDAITMLNEWEQAGYGSKVMLSNPMKNSKVRNELGDILEDNWVRVSVPAIAGPYADTYLDKFDSFVKQSDDYKDDLTVNNWSASAYDAITLSALAIQRGGEASHEAIERNLGPAARPPGKEVSTFAEGKKALQNGNDINYVGAQTRVDFDSTGDVFNAARIWELAPSEWTEVTMVSADKIKPVVQEVAKLAKS